MYKDMDMRNNIIIVIQLYNIKTKQKTKQMYKNRIV